MGARRKEKPMAITVYYTWYQFDDDVKKILNWIAEYRITIKGVYGIPKGGLPLAVTLANILHVPLFLDLKEADRSDRPGYTLLVDDVSDSGKTLRAHTDKLKRMTVTPFIKKGTRCKPDFWCREVPQDEYIIFPWEVISDD